MNKHLVSAKNPPTKATSIDEMEALLDRIAEFKEFMNSSNNTSDPRVVQEYRLFKQYIEWVSEDLATDSYICTANQQSSH